MSASCHKRKSASLFYLLVSARDRRGVLALSDRNPLKSSINWRGALVLDLFRYDSPSSSQVVSAGVRPAR
jgi:hypothetical protein